jgi:hypothetical protein
MEGYATGDVASALKAVRVNSQGFDSANLPPISRERKLHRRLSFNGRHG